MSDAPSTHACSLSGSGAYIIRVQGELERHWEAELRLRLTYFRTEHGMISILAGDLPDQAALLGALQWLNMWGYVIISMEYAAAGVWGDR